MDGTVTHVRLLVTAYTDCFHFYDDVLGLDATFGDADSGYADFDTGDVTLALFDADEMADALDESPRSGANGDRACVVIRVDDVDRTAATLREENVAIVAGPADHPEWGLRTVHVRDPDGTLVECNEPLDS